MEIYVYMNTQLCMGEHWINDAKGFFQARLVCYHPMMRSHDRHHKELFTLNTSCKNLQDCYIS